MRAAPPATIKDYGCMAHNDDYHLAAALLAYLAENINKSCTFAEIGSSISASSLQIADFLHHWAHALPLQITGETVLLPAGLAFYDCAALREAIGPMQILHSFALDSSNSWLWRHANSSAKAWHWRYRHNVKFASDPWPDFNPQQQVVVIPEWQLAGRGRRERTWLAPFAQNMLCSLGIPSKMQAADLHGLSLALAYEIASALRAVLPEEMAQKIQLKWPNDLALVDPDYRKLGGILIEYKNWQHADFAGFLIIGIGINCQVAPHIESAYKAAALAQISRNQCLQIVVKTCMQCVTKFSETGFAPWQNHWHQLHFFHKKPVVIERDCGSVQGICMGIGANGALLLATEHGQESILSGDLSLRAI